MLLATGYLQKPLSSLVCGGRQSPESSVLASEVSLVQTIALSQKGAPTACSLGVSLSTAPRSTSARLALIASGEIPILAASWLTASDPKALWNWLAEMLCTGSACQLRAPELESTRRPFPPCDAVVQNIPRRAVDPPWRRISMGPASQSVVASPASGARWVQLMIGIVGMVAIANLQYGWTLFVNPIDSKFHWGKAAIQVAFTLFVLAETWLVPFEGYLVDRFGPRLLVAVGGLLVGAAWWINAGATSLFMLYTGGLIGGVGAGIVYGTSVGNALKWFPDHRGLAAGLTAAAFGAGSALTIVPIQKMIASTGYESTFLTFGIGQGIVVVLMALFLAAPRPGQVAAAKPAKVRQSGRD